MVANAAPRATRPSSWSGHIPSACVYMSIAALGYRYAVTRGPQANTRVRGGGGCWFVGWCQVQNKATCHTWGKVTASALVGFRGVYCPSTIQILHSVCTPICDTAAVLQVNKSTIPLYDTCRHSRTQKTAAKQQLESEARMKTETSGKKKQYIAKIFFKPTQPVQHRK